MSESLEEKIERLYKYVNEWAAPYQSRKLLGEIEDEMNAGHSTDSEHEVLLMQCIDKLLKMATPIFCQCGHQMISHVNFDSGLVTGCSGSDGKCNCTIFNMQK